MGSAAAGREATNGQRAHGEHELREATGRPSGHRGVMPPVSLEELIGAHPTALRAMYAGGRPTDPGELGPSPRGRLLAIEPMGDAFLLVRPLVRALGVDAFPWKGKVFEPASGTGTNVVLGRRVFPFRTETARSFVDGRPTLVLRYDDPSLSNGWPLRSIVDELRTVAPGIAVGPVLFLRAAGEPRLLGWWGLRA